MYVRNKPSLFPSSTGYNFKASKLNINITNHYVTKLTFALPRVVTPLKILLNPVSLASSAASLPPAITFCKRNYLFTRI